ncbi:MAG: CO dehydrogenase/CO-methylating acetyl-CoA synthase complex subunit beta [Omnitrophica WOR_2 bacterium RIFOXYB2_FULL_45_11]|nr:MAG: CO dehydrogenase/CO-methylating acetyl-CoA synthase complex subunit beta [Omnitrophica WOR_2 bacterium RIFOXYB2_FULL_45_11]
MSKIVAAAAIRGSRVIAREAEEFLNKALKEHGPDTKIGFPETAFFLPMANALLGAEVKTLKEAVNVFNYAKGLLPLEPKEKLWLPYLGDALDAGIATLLCEEIITVLRYLYKQEPQTDCNGFFTDTILRSLGIQLVDGRMPGFAAILGAAPTNEIAVSVVRQLQERNILIFVGSSSGGRSIIDQLKESGVEMGWDNYIVPYGRDTISAIYPLNWAIRSAMTFGGLKAGQGKKCLLYTKERVFAFGLTLGLVDDLKYATGAGAINMGFPIIADTDIPEIKPSGITTYEALVKEFDYKKIVPRCIEVRGVKVKVSKIPIPVLYGAAFEGERVRREQLYCEFGGKSSHAFELILMRDASQIEDGKIDLIGPDVDQLAEKVKSLPLGILIEVAGRKLQKDFEPILERQLHRFFNYCMGVMHIGQRDMNWIRISKDAFAKGLRIKHLGIVLHAMIHEEFGAIADKVQVTLFTREEDVQRELIRARQVYAERDERLSGMTDESVDTFYSCELCQSFAPNHICVITPEKVGLCGAYSWLDTKAAYEIAPSGGNKPIPKGECLDPVNGEWASVNAYVNLRSNRTLERFSMYSMVNNPSTSCGCFECIMAVIPEANGIMVVHRDFSGMTPCGMTFTTLAGSVGGGIQTPGFLGVGKIYLTSNKFISADGGLRRLIWMPKELKELLGEKLIKRVREIGEPDLIDKIADETIATTSEELMVFLEKVKHPALTLPPLF